MDREARRAAKAQMVAHMQIGHSWHAAATDAGLQTSRASAYRLLRRVRTEGVVALDDQRHGHPTKVRQPVRDWLATFCRAAPEATGQTVQAALLEEFGLEVSVGQINRLRAALGIRRLVSGAGGKISRTDRPLSQPGRRVLGVCSCSPLPTRRASSRLWSRHSWLAYKRTLGWRTLPRLPATSPS